MSKRTVRLPGVLAQTVGSQRQFEVEGATLREALDDLVCQQPILRLHLFDEAGALRRHVRCFCNQEYSSEETGLDVALQPDDNITILSSVAGG